MLFIKVKMHANVSYKHRTHSTCGSISVVVLIFSQTLNALRLLTRCSRQMFLTFSVFRLGTCYQSGPGQRSRYSDSLWAGRPGERTLVGTRLSAPFQTGSGPPASFTMGTRSLYREVSGRSVDHPPQSSTKVKEIVELYL
jgi:hypothetical protein